MNGNDVRREWFEKDYYAVLGVSKDAPQDEIRKTYRRLAQKFHPDANPGDAKAEDRFKEISAAYDVIGDADKRARYDEVRRMAVSGGFPGGGAGGAGAGAGGMPFDFGGVGDIGDLFGGLFGGAGRGGRRGRQGGRGADLETEIAVSFDDALVGTTVPVRIDGPAPCGTCGGNGAAPGSTPVRCPRCGGSGAVAVNQGPFQMASGCPRCGATGRIVEQPCGTCRGSGAERRSRTFQVKVPAGVQDGARIRLAGRGEPGTVGSTPGDLFVRVRVRPHAFFGRDGANVTLELPVTYAEAALGAEVAVPTPEGTVTMKVPAGTASGRTFRLKGKGAPRRGGRGDLLVTVVVDVPAKLSRREKDLLKQLREERSESPRVALGVDA